MMWSKVNLPFPSFIRRQRSAAASAACKSDTITFPGSWMSRSISRKLSNYVHLQWPGLFSGRKRYLSFTFDDGFIEGARRADRLLAPHKATFYIITGWVRPEQVPITAPLHIGRDHGTIEDWRELAAKGHDIGSHTVSHIHADDPRAQQEYDDSLKFLKQIHSGPYTFASPFNEQPRADLSAYDSVRLGWSHRIYNVLSEVDPGRIVSWGPPDDSSRKKATYVALSQVPDGGWLVLNLHSLDEEGWKPWRSKSLQKLLNYALRCGYEIRTIAEMVTKIRARQ